MPFQKGHSASANTKWKPGQSGNPSGKPKSTLKQALEDAITKEEMAKRVAAIARSGDEQAALSAIRWAADRTEGKVPETKNVNISGKVKVQLKWADDEQE